MGIWNKRTLCLVTGASQGIGREIALQFSQNVSSDSTIILSARSEKGLAETAALISKAQPQITTKLFPYDMSNPKLEDFKSFLANYSSSEWDIYLLVHNAGSEGSGNFLKDCERPDEWQKYLSLNLISMASLTSAFLKTFNKDDKTVIVNITSLAAIQPFSGLGEYSVGKASREMYFKVLAAENPKLRILTYSPGPVSTAMIDRCIAKVQDADSKGMFDKMQREGTLVKAEDTIRKLVGLLAAGPSNISRVDYFDE